MKTHPIVRAAAGRDRVRGTAVLLAIIATLVVAGMAAAMISVSGAFERESEGTSRRLRALYAAEAGVAAGIAEVRANAAPNGGAGNATQSWSLGAADAPAAFGADGFWMSALDNGDDTFTVTAFGAAGDEVVGIESVLVRTGGGPFTSAVFAGNSSGDPLYDLGFGGKGGRADEIHGNVYSGGNITIKDDATIDGIVWATGAITGGSGGETGRTAPIPDIAAMNYETNHDIDVAAAFSAASYASNALGGSAWQLPEADPAHIFRKNPSDRASDTARTTKDDFFLEDPYETPRPGSTVTAASGTHITISGLPGKPGPSGNDKVYFVDGNLWLHNRNLYTFTMFDTGSEAIRVTFVVKGNVYFSDNLFYHHDQWDGVAFIAIEDSAVADSGNIYFGDPVFGTLEHMEAFMYAENNFYDNNLSATGSARVGLLGNMTAGNQVKITRDFGNQHSKLTVDFDDRLVTGELSLPGLPRDGGTALTWTVASWRRIAAH